MLVVTLADGNNVMTTDAVGLLLGVYREESAPCSLDMAARVLLQLTTNIILGMDFLRKYNPHVNWSRNTLSFVLDSCTVAVDAGTVPGSIRARLVSASAWLRELCAEPDLD